MLTVAGEKPHAVCVPFPAQGHINATLKLAKLLHFKGFHITFVHSEFNYRRILSSTAPSSLKGVEGFRFETIPDGLPLPDADEATQDVIALCDSVQKNCSVPFRNLIAKLNDPSSGVPPVTCIISDGATSFTLRAAAEFRIPDVFFWSTSACGFMAFFHYKQLIERGIFPLKTLDESYLSNGYLDTQIDWIPGMKTVRLGDIIFPNTDRDNILFNLCNVEAQRALEATAIVFNTFDELEGPVLEGMSAMLPPIYSVGPLTLSSRQMPESPLTSLGSSMWKEDMGCIKWLEGREPGSVLYINFGSLAVMAKQRFIEFAWGLANSGHDFLWVIRSDLVEPGDSALLPHDFLSETSGRCFLTSWCPQEEVLLHPAIGGFLTHSGWNSIMESICGRVPMLCWAFFGDQSINCRYVCDEWGIGMEISTDVRREEVEGLIRELMGGNKGKEMRRKALEWKERAVKATQPGGPSFENLEKMIKEALLNFKQMHVNADVDVDVNG